MVKMRLNKFKLNFCHRNSLIITNRKHSSLLTANFIRKTFIDYFLNESHYYIKSSSVRPFNDPTLEFVNAGMNQFKNVFLGLERIVVPRAVNSQKCIRVGGKHNDLNSVGKDNYHHTFFEMLGNWSFNDYFKKDACKLVWSLITSKPFSLDPKRLYVTYFKGDDSLKLSPDFETKEIWEEIGVAKDRILPFGLKENFWEMGPTGPCGPCTEIHYDHLGTITRSHLVNKDYSDLTELWNNVFVQFNRLENGSLIPLEKHFVDTGMGLERLVAILQGKSSNYDTDLFSPYFKMISKLTGCASYSGKFENSDEKELDTAYRILADHTRMISVAIADNVFPHESHPLRRVIRKGLEISEKFLPGQGVDLMVELSKIAGESFYTVFPEVSNNLRQIEFVLRDENNLWEEAKSKLKVEWGNLTKENPHLQSLSEVQSEGLILSVRELKKIKITLNSSLPQDFCLMLYDRHGLSPQVIEELAVVCGYSVNLHQLEKDILDLKEKNKASIYSSQLINLPRNAMEYIVKNFPTTDDSFKSVYSKDSNDEYVFEKLTCKVQGIINNDELIKNVSLSCSGSEIIILLDKTNLWSSLKGNGDKGKIDLFDGDKNKIGRIFIDRVFNVEGYIYHVGRLEMSSKFVDTPIEVLTAEISVDYKSRIDLMRNTSAFHLLSYLLQEKWVCKVQSCNVSHKEFGASYLTYGHKFQNNDIKKIEERMRLLIDSALIINMTKTSINCFAGKENLFLPPYITPNMKFIHLVDVMLPGEKSFKEVTIGPNVLNTKDIGEICFFEFENKSRGRYLVVSCQSGPNVPIVRKNCRNMLSSISNKEIDPKEKIAMLNSFMMENHIPLELKPDFLFKLHEIKAEVKHKNKREKIDSIQKALIEAKDTSKNCLALYVGHDSKLKELLQLSTDFPVMLFSSKGNYFSAKCYVPKGSSPIRASDWMHKVASKLGGECELSKDEAFSSMKPMKINKSELEHITKQSEVIANTVVDSLLSKN